MSPLIPYQDAIRILKSSAKNRSKKIEEVPLLQSMNRVIAEDVRASEFIPAFDNSAMDGFAVRSQDLHDGTNRILVAARSIAGDLPGTAFDSNRVVEIMTGAPMPMGGFDRIVKVEDVSVHPAENGARIIEFESSAAKPEFVRFRGTDFKPGDLLCSPGTLVDSKLILGLAALGVSRVPVFQKPRVALITTGNELVSFEEPNVPEGAVRNSTGPYLMEALKSFGCEVRNLGVMGDEASENPIEFDEALRVALEEGFDLILTTGAVSMGVHDFVKPSVVKNGGRVLFHKVAIKPGKPVLFAEFPDFPNSRLLGLPGNPISSVVGADFFLAPFLREWFCGSESAPLKGRILGSLPPTPVGLRTFLKAKATLLPEGGYGVEILSGQGSFMIHSLSYANAWAVIPETGAQSGEVVEFHLFQERLWQ